MSAMNYLKDENEKGRTKNGKNRLFVFMEIVQRTILSELAGSKPVVSYKDLLSVSQWSRATLTKFLASLLAEKVITINDNKSSEVSLAPRILLKIDEHSSDGQVISQSLKQAAYAPLKLFLGHSACCEQSKQTKNCQKNGNVACAKQNGYTQGVA